ncbi:MAG: TonB-dependent receptor [Cytophagales bacterium]|nr:MAG: TonB-dependent receptor [Cytophagales bacterium]TAF60669.1 MAG: TonB-dependent receptor [Cytophagales bacterium]
MFIAGLASCLVWLMLGVLPVLAQRTGIVSGSVVDKATQESLPGVTIKIENTTKGTLTDESGQFKLTDVPTGSINLVASFVGYKAETKYNVVITSGNIVTLVFELQEEAQALDEVKVTFNRSISVSNIETPLSIQRLSTEEIKSNPGGNFDISRVIQSLPGVGGTTGGGGFRNDIVIRGGAPNENVYYLDGIEIPVINHFSTQGSAGGPTGMLNVSFIEDVTLSSSSFDARYDNVMASVLQFKQREGNKERLQGNFRLSGTEAALTLEGPLSPKTTFLASARRSYLQLLFALIDLPIRPNYWDFQYKVVHKINPKTTLTALGVGAIDQFSFGVPRESTPSKEYVLRATPSIEQWNYTAGFVIKRLINKGYWDLALSRNDFSNAINRFEDGQNGVEELRILKIRSKETENKLRFNLVKNTGAWKHTFGLVAQQVAFSNNIYNRIRKELRDSANNVVQPAIIVDFNTDISFARFGAFYQTSRSFLKDRLRFSAGIRTDMNTFLDKGLNPLETLSPRVSLSYSVLSGLNLNASVGQYYKMPIYTVLGYQDASGNFVNKNNRYTQSTHYTGGLEWIPRSSTRFTLEGFYKDYNRYPVSIRDGISLANQGGDFGAIGNEAVTSSGRGRAYGLEFFAQQKLIKGIFTVFSYTYVRSEFTGADKDQFIASAWDSRHLISALFGRKFRKGWEIGMKYRFAGGAPYTPFDLVASQQNYASFGVGILDNTRLNSERLNAFNQFDFRIDKKWNFNRWTFDLYMDVTNALATVNPAFPQYTFERNEDNSGFKTTDGQPLAQDGSNAVPLILNDEASTVIPTIGFIIEF